MYSIIYNFVHVHEVYIDQLNYFCNYSSAIRTHKISYLCLFSKVLQWIIHSTTLCFLSLQVARLSIIKFNYKGKTEEINKWMNGWEVESLGRWRKEEWDR